jgi:hypothetical protein
MYLSHGDAIAFTNLFNTKSIGSNRTYALNGCTLWDGYSSIDSSWK